MVTDESLVSKGNLNDLLQAIDIEESPLVQADFNELGEGKSKKMKSSKKLQFDDQVSKFVFKPRRPVTRQSKRLQEVEPEVSEIGEISGFHEELVVPVMQPSLMHKDDRNRAIDTQEEENNYEEVKKKLKLSNLEIAKLMKRERKHAVEKANFKRMKALWKDGKASKPKVVSRDAQYFTWIVPTIKEARYIRWINDRLRTNIKVMKRKIEDPEIQLSKSGGQPQHK